MFSLVIPVLILAASFTALTSLLLGFVQALIVLTWSTVLNEPA